MHKADGNTRGSCGASENAGVENAGVSRMERQHEIILRKSSVTSLYLS